jgi:TusA-related sulfurtransferase
MLHRPDMTLDLRGRHCPYTVLELANAVRTVTGDGVVEVVVDDRTGLEEVSAWCDATGSEFLGFTTEGVLRAYVRRR